MLNLFYTFLSNVMFETKTFAVSYKIIILYYILNLQVQLTNKKVIHGVAYQIASTYAILCDNSNKYQHTSRLNPILMGKGFLHL